MMNTNPWNKSWLLALPLLIPLSLWPLAGQAGLSQEVAAFADEVASRNDLEPNQVTRILEQASNLEHDIRPRFTGSAERNWTWERYSRNFLSQRRIKNGVKFWDDYAGLFQQAAETYGIPPAILAAIVGVETNYGKKTGSIRVLDSLYTQAFHYPERARFGRKELEAFLVLAVTEGLDPIKVKGSYAGAMGKPQFIPTSYRQYAVDFDGDGRRDLWESTADIIGSVANYFATHGWRSGELVASPVDRLTNAHKAQAMGENDRPIPPKLELRQLTAEGLELPVETAQEQLGSLVAFNGREGVEYWLGLYNFYVITRYNHSYLYAMAVYQLSQEILAARSAQAR
jgi:membrane-bound lytic murein transglycosylase B